VSLALKGVGIDAQVEDVDVRPPTLQVVVGAPDRQVELRRTEAARQYRAVVAQREQFQTALVETQNDRERLRGELGTAQQGLAQANRELAKAQLRLLAGRAPQKNVIVRYVDFSDNTLAEHIVSMFRANTGWTATPVRDSSSHLLQETQNRIVFSSGDPEIVKDLYHIFNRGNLLNEPVSPEEIVERQTTDPDVIVTIFPAKSRA